MNAQLQELPELTIRAIRKWFVAYCKDAYPKYGTDRVERLSYKSFKEKALQHDRHYQDLFKIYEQNPELAQMSPELKLLVIRLEQELSVLEHQLCL
jgi:hypothetical protein